MNVTKKLLLEKLTGIKDQNNRKVFTRISKILTGITRTALRNIFFRLK